MRSTAYSIFMTLLLLIPISAVPLMAIFGVPQFTPLVSSPLDEAEEDDWDRPVRKKSRSHGHDHSHELAEDDVPEDEPLDWTNTEDERPRPMRRQRQRSRESADVDAEQSLAESDGFEESPPTRQNKKKSRPSKTSNHEADEQASIQLASNEVAEEETPFAASANYEEPQPPADDAAAAVTEKYRRQKSSARQDTEQEFEKSPSNKHKKRSAAATEPLSWQRLTERLNEYGIRNFRLESGEQPGEFSFTCTYTPSNSPHVTRKFEAIADDPLKAVAKVLAQVEEASQQKVMASPRRMTESQKPRDLE